MPAKLIQFPLPPVLTSLVQWAQKWTVVDEGQLSVRQRQELDRAVEFGLLIKGKGGPYLTLVTIWAAPDFDFSAERAAEIRLYGYLDRVTQISTRCRRAA